VKLMSKLTSRQILDFIWDTKIFLFYLKVGLFCIPLGALYIFVYWLITGEIPE